VELPVARHAPFVVGRAATACVRIRFARLPVHYANQTVGRSTDQAGAGRCLPTVIRTEQSALEQAHPQRNFRLRRHPRRRTGRRIARRSSRITVQYAARIFVPDAAVTEEVEDSWHGVTRTAFR